MMIAAILGYFRTGIWKPSLDNYRGIRRFLFKCVRIVALAVRGFVIDGGTLKASALTFYTLVSVVPVITMVLAVARGFGLDASLRRYLWISLPGQTALMNKVLGFADTLLRSSTGTLVTGIGVAVLIWTVTSALSNIEYAFDGIWEVSRPRRLSRRIPEYIALVAVSALLWILSVGILFAISHQLRSVGRGLGIPALSLLASALLQAGRFVLIWLLFTAGYVILPNTRIRIGTGLFGGLAGAAIYHLVEWIYLYFQVGVAGYNAVYGGFAAVPLFLVWVQITWMIVLFGAELAFSLENAETYGFAPDYSKLSDHTRKLLQLRIMHLLVTAFEQREGALGTRQISQRIEAPIRLLRPLLMDLTDAGLASRTVGADERHMAYQLARSPEQLTLASVLSAIEHSSPAHEAEPPVDGALPEALARFQAAIERVPENVRLSDIGLANPSPAADASGAKP